MRSNERKNETEARKAYQKPDMHSEKMFETNALACGKCTSGPVGQFQCGSLLQNS